MTSANSLCAIASKHPLFSISRVLVAFKWKKLLPHDLQNFLRFSKFLDKFEQCGLSICIRLCSRQRFWHILNISIFDHVIAYIKLITIANLTR